MNHLVAIRYSLWVSLLPLAVAVHPAAGHKSLHQVTKSIEQLLPTRVGGIPFNVVTGSKNTLHVYDNSNVINQSSLAVIDALHSHLFKKVTQRMAKRETNPHRFSLLGGKTSLPELVGAYANHLEYQRVIAEHFHKEVNGKYNPLKIASADIIPNNGSSDYSGKDHTDPFPVVIAIVYNDAMMTAYLNHDLLNLKAMKKGLGMYGHVADELFYRSPLPWQIVVFNGNTPHRANKVRPESLSPNKMSQVTNFLEVD